MQEYNTLKTLVAEAETPEDTSKHLTRLASVRSDAQTAEGELETLSQRMEAKRRWVKPYKKGSLGSAPKSHTYVLGGKPTENGGEMLKRGGLGDDRRTNP